MSIQLVVESPKSTFEDLVRGSDRNKLAALGAFQRFVEKHTKSVHLNFSESRCVEIFALHVRGEELLFRILQRTKPEWIEMAGSLLFMPTADCDEMFKLHFVFPFPGEPLVLDITDINSLSKITDLAYTQLNALSDEDRMALEENLYYHRQAIALARKENCLIFCSV
jgi:hypothetical protein